MRNYILFLLLSILAISKLHLLAQINDITHLPVQNMDETIFESAPVIISESEVMIFYVNSTQDTILYTASRDGGNNWEIPNAVIAVELGLTQTHFHPTSLRSSSGRILVAWAIKSEGILIFSDDSGATWSQPQSILSVGNPAFQKRIESLNLSQLDDGKILLSFNDNSKRKIYFIQSSDDGVTWSEEAIEVYSLPPFKVNGLTVVSSTEENLLAVFEGNPGFSCGIYELISTDNGLSWSDTIRIVNTELYETIPKIVKRSDGSLLLTYLRRESTQVSNFNQDDIYYMISSDGGDTWQEEKRFTKYVGNDENLNISHYSGKTFISFASQRFTNNFQISYGIFEQTIESFKPPYVISSIVSPSEIELDTEEITFQATIIDDNSIDKVYAFSDDSVVTGELFDDGLHNDEEPNDNIFANTLPLAKNHNSVSYVMKVNKIVMPANNKGILADIPALHSFGAKIQSIDVEGYVGKYFKDIELEYSIYKGVYEESSFLFSGGFYLSGYTNGELWANAVATVSIMENYLPGKVDGDPHDPRNLIYIINSTDKQFGIRWQQWKDAVQLGADFYDGDNDGIYNPVDKNWNGIWDPTEDMPDLLGDQTAWCVYNDGETNRIRFADVDPQGIEIQQTLFASNLPELENVIFIRYRIINRGTVSETLDSVYFAFWSDPDLGVEHGDDLVGCDTTLNSAICYNDSADYGYGENPPALFTTLIQGPVKQSPNPDDIGYDRKGPQIGSEEFLGYENQSITAFIHYRNSDPYLGDPWDEIGARNYMLGLHRLGFEIDPCDSSLGGIFGGIDCNGINRRLWYSGDPVEMIGWIMTRSADQRSLLSTGPFKLEKDKPVSIIGAFIMGRGTDAINSITVARANVQRAIEEYNNNFRSLVYDPGESAFPVTNYILYHNYPNPFNPTTTIRYELPQDGIVTIDVYDILGQRVRTLVNEFKKADRYEVEFNAFGLASGVYFYRMKVNDFITSKKMILLR